MNDALVPPESLPSWFAYPAEFLEALQCGFRDVGPWQVLSGKWLMVRFEGLKKRFPDRDLVPFARRLDNDDVACWERSLPGSVQIIHDFASPGWEERAKYPSFNEWLEAAKSEAGELES